MIPDTAPRFPWNVNRVIHILLVAVFLFLTNSGYAQEDDPKPESAIIPATRAGNQLMWVIKVLNGQELGDLKDHFSDRFIQTKGEETTDVLTGMRAQVFDGGKILVNKILDSDRDVDISAEITGKDSWRYLHVFLILDDKSGKIAGLRFAPAGGIGRNMGNWNQFDEGASRMPGGISFAAYEIVHRNPNDAQSPLTLRAIAETGADKRLAISSTSSLYVLGALAEQVKAGKATWTEKIKINPQWNSLQGGEPANVEAGAEFPLSDFVERMIAQSDNTAADHLIHRVGREQIEQYMATINLEPERTYPFLTTSEAFKLKLSKDKDLLARYATADIETRRKMLADGGEVAKAPLNAQGDDDWTTPIEIEKVEWFASATECCRAMMDLHRLEKLPGMEPMSQALRMKSGLKLNRDVWPQVAYKGGSEPGVLNMTWMLERDDGRMFVMSIGWNNEEKTLQEARLIDMANAAIRILADEGRPKAPPAKLPDPPKDAPKPKRF